MADPFLISVIVFVAVAAMVAAIVFMFKDSGVTTAEERLAVMTGQRSFDDEESASLIKDGFREGSDGVGGLLRKLAAKLSSLSLLFEQADSPIRPETFLGISIFAGFLGFALSAVLKTPLPLVPVFMLLMSVMPLMWLLLRRARRFKKFAAQLPDALELVARALRSGHSLSSGLFVVVEEMPMPICTEFGNAYEEQNLGVPIEQSLKNMLRRMPNLDLKFFVTAVAIQRQSGGDLAEILDKIGHIIRERFKILGAVKALTGEGRISGIVLMALPIALFFAVYHLNPDYVMLLFTDELGRQMIAYAAGLQVAGALAIKKIVAIKV